MMAPSTTVEQLPTDQRLVAFTSVAANYIPLARILGRSIKKFHPEWHFVLALADQPPSWLNILDEPFDEVLALPHMALGSNPAWLFSHDIEELCTAIKPFVMESLLARSGVSACLYFDPDMVLFDRLDDLVNTLENADILLTPHLVEQEITREGIIDNEIASLRHGIYNLGFLGVTNNANGRSLVSWWRNRTHEFCLARVDLHLWTDQKWFNHVPVFFDRVIALKSPRFNVAPWNLSTRAVTRTGRDAYFVNDEPLGFYHFTGFNNGDHSTQAARFAPDNDAVMSLLSWYADELRRERDASPPQPWAYESYSSGEAIRWIHRLIYRYRPDLQAAFPDPFEANGYFRWLSTQGELELGEVIHFVENRKLDIPEIPKADWLKSLPPPFHAAPPYGPPNIAAVSRSAATHGPVKTQVLRNAFRLTMQAMRSGERRRALWRMARALYRTHGLKGIRSKLASRT